MASPTTAIFPPAFPDDDSPGLNLYLRSGDGYFLWRYHLERRIQALHGADGLSLLTSSSPNSSSSTLSQRLADAIAESLCPSLWNTLVRLHARLFKATIAARPTTSTRLAAALGLDRLPVIPTPLLTPNTLLDTLEALHGTTYSLTRLRAAQAQLRSLTPAPRATVRGFAAAYAALVDACARHPEGRGWRADAAEETRVVVGFLERCCRGNAALRHVAGALVRKMRAHVGSFEETVGVLEQKYAAYATMMVRTGSAGEAERDAWVESLFGGIEMPCRRGPGGPHFAEHLNGPATPPTDVELTPVPVIPHLPPILDLDAPDLSGWTDPRQLRRLAALASAAADRLEAAADAETESSSEAVEPAAGRAKRKEREGVTEVRVVKKSRG
ncbi:hypothetical protein HDU96_008435 [Phlyctochytrium bullatum]|nr:hypothetical protein HDU96_008435 [Phlyctochytrium bullatum]